MTGYYEIANRMVLQFRTLLVSANQVLVPFIADLQETTPERIREVFSESYCLLMYLALPYYTAIIVVLPVISELLIGNYNLIFITFSILLVIAWLLNSLNAPAYFVNLGTGKLRWNTVSHIIIGILNAGLGLIFGMLYGGFGVVVAWAVSLGIGSAVITLPYLYENKIPLSFLFPKENRLLTLLCIISTICSFLFYYNFAETMGRITSGFLALAVFTGIIFYPLWMNSRRKQLMKWIF